MNPFEVLSRPSDDFRVFNHDLGISTCSFACIERSLWMMLVCSVLDNITCCSFAFALLVCSDHLYLNSSAK